MTFLLIGAGIFYGLVALFVWCMCVMAAATDVER